MASPNELLPVASAALDSLDGVAALEPVPRARASAPIEAPAAAAAVMSDVRWVEVTCALKEVDVECSDGGDSAAADALTDGAMEEKPDSLSCVFCADI